MTQDKFEALINGQKIPRERLAEMFDELTETSEIRRHRERLGVGRNGRITSSDKCKTKGRYATIPMKKIE